MVSTPLGISRSPSNTMGLSCSTFLPLFRCLMNSAIPPPK